MPPLSKAARTHVPTLSGRCVTTWKQAMKSSATEPGSCPSLMRNGGLERSSALALATVATSACRNEAQQPVRLRVEDGTRTHHRDILALCPSLGKRRVVRRKHVARLATRVNENRLLRI